MSVLGFRSALFQAMASVGSMAHSAYLLILQFNLDTSAHDLSTDASLADPLFLEIHYVALLASLLQPTPKRIDPPTIQSMDRAFIARIL